MATAEKKPALAIVFGKGKGGDADAPADDAAGDDENAEFEQAYSEYEASPSADTFMRAVKACVGSY